MWAWSALAIVIATAGCSGMRVEGDCLYVRKVETSYQCEPGGKLEHYRLEPAPD